MNRASSHREWPAGNASAPTAAANDSEVEPTWLEMVREYVGSLRYGVVQIIVHDARLTQIEMTERLRLEKPLWDNP